MNAVHVYMDDRHSRAWAVTYRRGALVVIDRYHTPTQAQHAAFKERTRQAMEGAKPER